MSDGGCLRSGGEVEDEDEVEENGMNVTRAELPSRVDLLLTVCVMDAAGVVAPPSLLHLFCCFCSLLSTSPNLLENSAEDCSSSKRLKETRFCPGDAIRRRRGRRDVKSGEVVGETAAT